MQNDDQVKKIIEYLQGKIANLKERLEKFETPIMVEQAMKNPGLQMEYLRLQARIDEIEDNLLAIQKFSSVPEIPKAAKGIKKVKKPQPPKNAKEG
jgi:hypothetical protein